MALPPFVGQSVRIAKETNYGVAPATVPNRLNALKATITPTKEKAKFSPSGSRLPTGMQAIDDFTAATFDGPLSFTDIIYPLGSLFGEPVSIAAGAGGFQHTFEFTGIDNLDPVSYTVHYGDAVRARQTQGFVFNGLSFETNREGELTMSAPGFGKKLELDIDGTSTPPFAAAPTDILAVPIGPLLFSIWMERTEWGDIGTTQMLYCFNANFEVGERLGRVRPINRLLTSDDVVEAEDQTITLAIDVMADATGEEFLNDLDAGTMLFGRLQAVGPVYVAGNSYTLQFDFAYLLDSVSEYKSVQGGVTAFTLSGEIARDTVSGNGMVAVVKNMLAGIA